MSRMIPGRYPSQAEGGTFYRHGTPAALFWGLAALAVAIAAFLLVVPPWSPWQLLFVPINLGMAAACVRWARIGVYLDEKGVRNARMFRTVHIPWDNFERFVLRPRELIDNFVFARLRDGSLVWMQGVGPRSRLRVLNDGGEESVVRKMNRRAAELKAMKQST